MYLSRNQTHDKEVSAEDIMTITQTKISEGRKFLPLATDSLNITLARLLVSENLEGHQDPAC